MKIGHLRRYLLVCVLGALYAPGVYAAPAKTAQQRAITPAQDKANLQKVLSFVERMNGKVAEAVNASAAIEEATAADASDKASSTAQIQRIKSQTVNAQNVVRNNRIELEGMQAFDLSFVSLEQRKSLKDTLRDSIAQLKNFENLLDKSETMILAIEQGESQLVEELLFIRSETGVEIIAFQAKSARSIFTGIARNSSNSAVTETIAIAYEAMENVARALHGSVFNKEFVTDAAYYRQKSAAVTKAIARGKLEYRADLLRFRPIIYGADKVMAARFKKAIDIQLEWFNYAPAIVAKLDKIANELDAGKLTQDQWRNAIISLVEVEAEYDKLSSRKVAALQGR